MPRNRSRNKRSQVLPYGRIFSIFKFPTVFSTPLINKCRSSVNTLKANGIVVFSMELRNTYELFVVCEALDPGGKQGYVKYYKER